MPARAPSPAKGACSSPHQPKARHGPAEECECHRRCRVQATHRGGRFTAQAKDDDVGVEKPCHAPPLLQIGQGASVAADGCDEALVIRQRSIEREPPRRIAISQRLRLQGMPRWPHGRSPALPVPAPNRKPICARAVQDSSTWRARSSSRLIIIVVIGNESFVSSIPYLSYRDAIRNASVAASPRFSLPALLHRTRPRPIPLFRVSRRRVVSASFFAPNPPTTPDSCHARLVFTTTYSTTACNASCGIPDDIEGLANR